MKQKKETKKPYVVLGIAAHPDDLDFTASGTVAKWVQEGAVCYYLICTDGSKGSGDPTMTPKKLVQERRKEQINAGKILGLKDVFFLTHKDTELYPTLELKKEIVYYIRTVKPDTVITLDPTVFYSIKNGLPMINHTDHRAVGEAAIDAVFPLARDRLTFPEHERIGLLPHKVTTLYLINFEKQTDIIDISRTMDIKRKALLAHKSQINDWAIKRMRQRAEKTGKKKGYTFAEGFVKIDLPA